MDSSSSSSHSLISNTSKTTPPAIFDPNSSPNNTTFVETDPSNFKSIVQKLTGADQAKPTSAAGGSGDNGISTHHWRYPFKLHQRRSGRNLEIKVQHGVGSYPGSGMERVPFVGLVSPVSTLEMILARGGGSSSPLTPRSPSEEEERVIAEKGFYLHPSPLNTPGRNGSQPPELLPLFPLSSPRDATNTAADDSRTNQ